MTVKRWLQSALTLGVVAVGVAVVQTPAHATGEVYGPYFLMSASTFLNPDNQQCIDDPKSSTANNVVMQIYKCNGTSAQRWYNETAVTNSDYWTFNEASHKCLTVQNASTASGAKVLQFTCSSGTNERWTYQVVDSSHTYQTTIGGRTVTSTRVFEIKNLKSHLCLTTNQGGLSSGTQLVQVGCGNVTPDYWIQFPF
jgi:hypothetical protein